MTDSEFWRDLESRFRALQPDLRHDLRADWISTAWNDAGEQWFISGGTDKRTRIHFQWLAERGVIKLGHNSGAAAVFYWLDLLKRDSPNFRINGSSSSWRNGEPTKCEIGVIEPLCEASADYCVKLENESIANSASKAVLRGAESIGTAGKRSPKTVELGEGGVKFVRRGEYTFAEPCEKTTRDQVLSGDNSTISAVRISYDVLSAELPKVYSLVKAKNGSISGTELRKQFRSSPLSRVADKGDWDGWAEDFSPCNRDRGRPKGAALTFLERKMSLNRSTLKSYLSRSNKPAKM